MHFCFLVCKNKNIPIWGDKAHFLLVNMRVNSYACPIIENEVAEFSSRMTKSDFELPQ